MKNLAKKTMVPAFAAACLILAAGQAQAVTVDVFNLDTDAGKLGAYDWLQSQGMTDLFDNVTILESFEGSTASNNPDPIQGWYNGTDQQNPNGLPELVTGVGTFTSTGEAGTGGTSYDKKTDGLDGQMAFEVRNYDDNGRYNVYPFGDDGTNYLDSADITELTLTLNPGVYENLFFTMTDAGDVYADTEISAINGDTGSNTIEYSQSNGSLWFVGIDGQDDMLSSITWNVVNNEDGTTAYTNDGFGLDSFGTVPEPATALLLGTAIPLLGFLRRKKEEDEV